MLNNYLNSHPDTNLVVVRLNCPGGEMDACLRLARVLAELDPARIRTVAFVETAAAGSAALIATACDQLIMADASTIGGPDIAEPNPNALTDSRELIKLVAEARHRDWSVPMGLVDPDLQVTRYRNRVSGEVRLLCDEERMSMPDAELWISMGAVDLASSLPAKLALDLTLARSTVVDFEQLKKFYQLSETPVQLEPSKTDRWIEEFARLMASPMIAAWLLFGAVFLLSTEMSNPGIGIPGFLGTLCLLVFFWSQYLDGNANWLEIMLFGAGAVFLLLEVFVLPGFGIFGIGGLIMIVVSIVLATQTFIIPRNSEEFARMPVSISMVLAASGGFFAALYFIRRYMTTLPFFRRIMLAPPGSDDTVSPDAREHREALAQREHLLGRSGKTTTPLVPAGKAQIGSELVDVITDGRMVERGTPVRVIQVLGNRVIVEPDNPCPPVS
jgi:membrane-bound ClpP family serine protease